jgi:transposase InsO family protein
MRCALIEAEKANYPIAWMCRQLAVPRSSFYAWRAAADTVTATAARRQVLAELVAKVFEDSRGTYGCRRVAAELNRQGHPAGVGLIADLMRELELVACQPRSYKTTTIAGEEPVETPDLIEREFTASAPGQRLVGDITSWVCRRVGISARRCSARVLVEPLAE